MVQRMMPFALFTLLLIAPVAKGQSTTEALADLPVPPSLDQIQSLAVVSSASTFSTVPSRPPNLGPHARRAVGSAERDQRFLEMRAAVLRLGPKRNRFVHVDLLQGKALTGTIVSIDDSTFGLQTEALGGIHQVAYNELAAPPRHVAAVGTRFKQGAQWTGFGILVAVGIPIIVVLSPFLYLSGWDC